MELAKPCDRYYRKLNHSWEKTIAVNITGLFSQVSLVDFSIMHFSTVYKNVLFLHLPRKKIETIKRLRLDNETLLIYICWNSAAGFGVMCVLLRQAPRKRKMTFSGKEFPSCGWMHSEEVPSTEDGRYAPAKSGTVISSSLGPFVWEVEPP